MLSVVVQRGDEPPLARDEGRSRAVMAASASVRTRSHGAGDTHAEHKRLAKLVDGSSADGFRLVAVAFEGC